MKYCFVAKKEVYSCDHYDCNRNGSDKKYGSKINGMRWCQVTKSHVYSCDHYDCNK